MRVLFKKSKLQLALFMAPTVILFAVIIIYSLIQTFTTSFTQWNGLSAPVFNGIDNYIKLAKSRDLPVSIRNSVIYSIVLTIYQLGFATFFAYCIVNMKLKGKNFYKAIFFVPVLLSVSVVAQLWIAMYHGDFGLINNIAESLGFKWQQTWLSEPYKGIIAIVIADAWKGMGYHMLLIYAAMRNVPTVYYEAATVDGANSYKQFANVTLPLVAPTLRICFVMCITYGFRAFEMIFVMTGGGPGNYTTTMSLTLYDAIFKTGQYGYGSAIATIIVIICVSTMLIVNKLTERFEVRY